MALHTPPLPHGSRAHRARSVRPCPAATFSIGGSLQREYKNRAEGRERLQAVGEKHQRASVRKCGRMLLVRRAIRTVEAVMRAHVQMELRVVSSSEAFLD